MNDRDAALASLAMARIEFAAPETGKCPVCGRELDHNAAALYWAFVAGMRVGGRDYYSAKGEAAALGIVPPCLRSVPVRASAGECDMNDGRRAALRSLELARGLLKLQDAETALYWAFIAGMSAAGWEYYAARGEAKALSIVPPSLRD